MAGRYFEANYHRMPMISKAYFYERLPFVFAKPKADFVVLCLGIHLITQFPAPQMLSMQSSLYVLVKNTISLLESTGFLSLEVVQARLLVSFYEMGHGLHPTASISIGACARTARALGLNKKSFQRMEGDHTARLRAEEEKRAWWAVINLDRCVFFICREPLPLTLRLRLVGSIALNVSLALSISVTGMPFSQPKTPFPPISYRSTMRCGHKM